MNIRIWIFRIFGILAFCVLFGRLAYLQLFQGSYYEKLAEGNRTRSLTIEAPRGVIFDRNGKPLVRNEVSFTVTVIPEEVTNHLDSINLLANLLHLSRKSILKKLYKA